VATVLVVAVIVRRQRIVSREDAALVAVSLAVLPLALRYSRNITPFILIAVPALSRLIVLPERAGSSSHRRERFGLNAIFVAVCLFVCTVAVLRVWAVRAPRLAWVPLSQAVIAGIRACPGRLYNRFDEGGYVIWFAREAPVFVDNRQDPYPLPFLQEHLHSEQSGEYEPVFARYALQCAFLPTQSPTTHRLLAAGWAVTAQDHRWLVLRRPDPSGTTAR
jgi:hypothetical protein